MNAPIASSESDAVPEQFDAILADLENAATGAIDDASIPSTVRQLAPDELEAAGLPREFLSLTPPQRFNALRAARGHEVSPREIGRILPDVAPVQAPGSFQAKIESADPDADLLEQFKREEDERIATLKAQPSAEELDAERDRLREAAIAQAEKDRIDAQHAADLERTSSPDLALQSGGDAPAAQPGADADGFGGDAPEQASAEFDQPASTAEGSVG